MLTGGSKNQAVYGASLSGNCKLSYAETLHGLGLKVYIDNSFYLKKKNIKVI